LRQLQDMSITVSLTWIPGHMGIEYNKKADQLAKSALARQPDRQTETLTYLACKTSDSEENQQTVGRKMGQVAYR